MADEIFDPSFRKYPDGSSGPVFGPAPDGQRTIIVVARRCGLTLPLNSRTPAKVNHGESVAVDAAEADELISDGYAVRPSDDPNLDETPVIVAVKAPFRFRGKDFVVEKAVILPAFFAARARQLELVGDVPPPEKKRELSAASKAAIENRVVQRRRAEAHRFVQELLT